MLKGKKMLWKKMKQTGGGVPAACMRWCVPENRVSYTVISIKLQISEVDYTNSLIIASAACQSQVRHGSFPCCLSSGVQVDRAASRKITAVIKAERNEMGATM